MSIPLRKRYVERTRKQLKLEENKANGKTDLTE